MMKTLAACTALLCLTGASAHAAAKIERGLYQFQILYTSVNDPSGECGSDLYITAGGGLGGEAVVGGAGKAVTLTASVLNPGVGGLTFSSLAFPAFPSTITDPVNYSGTATGSQFDNGVTLSWSTGTLNTISGGQFKATLSNVTVSYGGTPVCTVNIDSTFLYTGQ